jgi:hypothetical protein
MVPDFSWDGEAHEASLERVQPVLMSRDVLASIEFTDG